MNYNSFYKQFANMTLDWLPMDTETLYKKNLDTRYNDLKNNGWINTPITYKFNSNGFRCDEFSNEPSIMFLGCSHTCGIGLPIQNIWPEIVSKNLKMRCANLAIGGGSSDTAFRLAHGWIDIVKPKLVIFAIPTGIRTELVTSDSIKNLSINSIENQYFSEWIIDDNNHYFNKMKNSFAIKYLCEQRNIKYVEYDLDNLEVNYLDYARDLVHAGVKTNMAFANQVLTSIS